MLEEKPDLIGITSGMTYWYPGVFKLIEITKDFFKDVPLILGGIYATLCHEHAQKYSGADIVFKSGNELEAVKLISKLTGFRLRHEPRWIHGCPEPNMVQGELPIPQSPLRTEELPYPAFDLYSHLDYVCITTTRGCPFRCTYCASHILSKRFVRRDPLKVVDEIEHWTTQFHIHNHYCPVNFL